MTTFATEPPAVQPIEHWPRPYEDSGQYDAALGNRDQSGLLPVSVEFGTEWLPDAAAMLENQEMTAEGLTDDEHQVLQEYMAERPQRVRIAPATDHEKREHVDYIIGRTGFSSLDTARALYIYGDKLSPQEYYDVVIGKSHPELKDMSHLEPYILGTFEPAHEAAQNIAGDTTAQLPATGNVDASLVIPTMDLREHALQERIRFKRLRAGAAAVKNAGVVLAITTMPSLLINRNKSWAEIKAAAETVNANQAGEIPSPVSGTEASEPAPETTVYDTVNSRGSVLVAEAMPDGTRRIIRKLQTEVLPTDVLPSLDDIAEREAVTNSEVAQPAVDHGPTLARELISDPDEGRQEASAADSLANAAKTEILTYQVRDEVAKDDVLGLGIERLNPDVRRRQKRRSRIATTAGALIVSAGLVVPLLTLR